MKISVRHLEEADKPKLVEIYSHASVLENTTQISHLGSARINKLFEVDNQIVLVAVIDGEVVGHISLYTTSKPRCKHVADLALAVAPEHQGQGVGKVLLKEALDMADNWLNLVRVQLEVYTDNPGAIALYKKFEFEVEGEKKFSAFKLGQYCNTLQMARIQPNLVLHQNTF